MYKTASEKNDRYRLGVFSTLTKQYDHHFKHEQETK